MAGGRAQPASNVHGEVATRGVLLGGAHLHLRGRDVQSRGFFAKEYWEFRATHSAFFAEFRTTFQGSFESPEVPAIFSVNKSFKGTRVVSAGRKK